MSFPTMTPFEVISLGDISISLGRGHYHFATTLSNLNLSNLNSQLSRLSSLEKLRLEKVETRES
jgi:hypothetical protein